MSTPGMPGYPQERIGENSRIDDAPKLARSNFGAARRRMNMAIPPGPSPPPPPPPPPPQNDEPLRKPVKDK